MSLGGPKRPDHLPWERDYPKYFLTCFIGLMLHGFDTWYWFSGIWQMKPTPGVEAFGLMIYFGRIDIFGWISYIMKVFVVTMLCIFTKGIIEALVQQYFERKVDHEVPPARLKQLARQWVKHWNRTAAFDLQSDGLRARKRLAAPNMAQASSSASIKSAPVPHWRESHDDELVPERDRDAAIAWQDAQSEPECSAMKIYPTARTLTVSTTPNQKVVRTMSNKFRKAMLGWQEEHAYSDGQRMYRYTPCLPNLARAVKLLESINRKSCRSCSALRWHVDQISNVLRLLYSFLIRRPLPRALFAVKMHIRALDYAAQCDGLEMLRLAIVHSDYSILAAEDIILASRVLLVLHPHRKKTRWEKLAVAWATFATCSILVIGTELAIQWNEISGVQDIGVVGQLIPMAIGIFGLAKTMWTALFDRGHGETWCFGKCRYEKKASDWEAAVAEFEKARNAWQLCTETEDKVAIVPGDEVMKNEV